MVMEDVCGEGQVGVETAINGSWVEMRIYIEGRYSVGEEEVFLEITWKRLSLLFN